MSFTAGAGTRFVVTSASSQSSGTVLTGPITATAGTATTNTPAFDITQTWNNAGVTFTGFRFNVTDTASNASSLLMDLQVGGTGRFRVTKNGWMLVGSDLSSASSAGRVYLFKHPGSLNDVYLYNVGEVQLRVVTQGSDRFNFSLDTLIAKSSGSIGFSSSADVGLAPDVSISRDAANTLAQRNGVNAQTFNVYNTFTDASNYERGVLQWAANILTIGAQSAGTGSARDVVLQGGNRLYLRAGGVTSWELNAANGHILAATDNAFDIGASGANRPRTVFAATSVLAPYVRTSTAYTVATLPAAGTAGAGARAYVTDANATTFASVVAGGGANIVPVMSNGTNWIIG